jgi:hypothetical protein
MPERYAPGLPALHATAACTGEDTLLQNGASRMCPKLIMEGGPVCPRSPAAGYPRGAAASGAGAHARTWHIATYEPGSGPDSEHAAEWPGASAALALLLLHDFPDPGRFHRFPCSSPPSDTMGVQLPRDTTHRCHGRLQEGNASAPALLNPRDTGSRPACPDRPSRPNRHSHARTYSTRPDARCPRSCGRCNLASDGRSARSRRGAAAGVSADFSGAATADPAEG